MELLRARIEECRHVVHVVGSGGFLSKRREKFFFLSLSDMVRDAEHILAFYQFALSSQVYIADGAELLMRKMVEQTIICCWIHQQESDEPIDRYLKTSAIAFETSWDRKIEDEEKNLPVDRLPKFARMAEKSIPGIYQAYKRLSYLQHADSHQFYTMIEHEHLTVHGRSNRDYFVARMADTLKNVPELLQHVKLYLAIEYGKNHPGKVEFLP